MIFKQFKKEIAQRIRANLLIADISAKDAEDGNDGLDFVMVVDGVSLVWECTNPDVYAAALYADDSDRARTKLIDIMIDYLSDADLIDWCLEEQMTNYQGKMYEWLGYTADKLEVIIAQ